MSRKLSLFVVDDDAEARALIQNAFESDHLVETFADGDSCLARLETLAPDLFFLASDPGDERACELWGQIKKLPQCQRTPVICLAAREDFDARMRSFDAGALDYLVKPLNLPEVRQKITFIERWIRERSDLQSRVDESDMLSSLIMSNLDEYAILVRFLRELNNCERHQQIADAFFHLLQAYKLDGTVQFRMDEGEFTLNAAGPASPLEESIVRQIRGMGSILQFKTRAAFNYSTSTLLVNNMPLDDPELCGRLRDHLAIAVETANAKLQALEDKRRVLSARSGINELTALISKELTDFRDSYLRARRGGSLATESVIREMHGFLSGMALTDGQEEEIDRILRAGIGQLVACYDLGQETENTFNTLVSHLHQALDAAGAS